MMHNHVAEKCCLTDASSCLSFILCTWDLRLRFGVTPWMSASNSVLLPILPSDRWKENPMETGHCSVFLWKLQHCVSLPAAISPLSGGDIVCEVTVSYRCHLNVLLHFTAREIYNYCDCWCSRKFYMVVFMPLMLLALWCWHVFLF